uniref:Sulfotransfer_1 domain-containing protein n=1 Tax=Parastrongyloides trichosuri TaxID=131310 RepID=A0A0N4ZN51_PARTI
MILYGITKSQNQRNTLPHRYQFFIKTIDNKTVTNCDEVKQEYICVPLKDRNWGTYVVAPKYKLNVCVIGKNFSTMLIAMICYLFNSKKYKNYHRSFAYEKWNKRSCIRKNEGNSFLKVSKKFSSHIKSPILENFIEDWNHLLVVRDPIERFLSGYVHFCANNTKDNECFGCKNDMICFVERLYDDIVTTVKTDEWASLHLMNHFYPQSWMCQVTKYYNKYTIIKYSSDKDETTKFYNEILEYLKKHNVSSGKINFIKKQFSNKVPHTTVDTKERNLYKKQLEDNDYIKDMLSRIYFSDFKLFNYSLPELKNYQDAIGSKNVTN